MRRLMLAAALAALAIPTAHAQVVRGDQLVAQSNFVSRQQAALPYISIVVRADFVLFSVRYETATRSADARENELAAVFKSVTDRAARTEGMNIEVGQPGFSAAVETAAIKELIQDRGDDRSAIDIVLKVNIRERETFDQVRTRAERFVRETPLTGRVEAIIGDSQFLGVAEPKKHRDALVKAIADDVKMMQASFGGPNAPVRVSLSGMEQRASTRPVGPLDLEIYIPYSMSLTSGTGN